MSNCPNCGYCPHCGRSSKPNPIYPAPYPQYPQPIWYADPRGTQFTHTQTIPIPPTFTC